MSRINEKFKRAFYFICLSLLFFGLSAEAATIEKIEIGESDKIIQITGLCAGDVVAVHIGLFSSTEPLYTAGDNCYEGSYSFKDDLRYWKFTAGDYWVKTYDNNHSLTNPSNEAYFKLEDIINYAAFATTTETVGPMDPPAEAWPEIDLSFETGDWLPLLFNAISAWFKQAVIMIKELIVEKIIVSEFCLGETCLNENRLKDLLKVEADAFEPKPVSAPAEQNLSSGLTITEFSTGTLESADRAADAGEE